MLEIAKKHLGLILILFCYIFFLTFYFDYVTIWDAQTNTGLVVEAAKKPFDFFYLEISSHPNQAYFIPQLLLQYLDTGNMVFFHIIDTLFGLVLISAFYLILRCIQKGKGTVDIFLITFMVAFYPVFTANAMNVIYDFTLTAYMLCTIFFLFKKRFVLAALSGLGQFFSKEPGIAIYGITLVLYYLLFVDHKLHIKTYSSNLRKIMIGFTPFAFLLLYTVVKSLLVKSNVFFSTQAPVFLTAKSFTSLWPTWDISKVRLSFYVTIFILNFNWILTLVIFCGLLIAIYRIISKRIHEFNSIHIRESLFILVLAIPVFVIHTYVKIFTNARYFMPFYALFILLFFISLRLIPHVLVRRSILTIVIVLVFISNIYTIDPLSKVVYGTFKFGNHEMLKINSLTGECCGYGRDQLVYNMQYIYIERLTNDIFKKLKPTPETFFAMDRIAGNIFSLQIDKITFQRTWRSENTFVPADLTWTFYTPGYPRPDKVYFIDYPFVGPTDTMKDFLSYYTITATEVFERDGYKLSVYTLTKKV